MADLRPRPTSLAAVNHSRHSSSQSTASESLPVSPTTSSFGHLRHHSSASSLSSSPPQTDAFDLHPSSKRSAPSLPKVQEAPEERESHHGETSRQDSSFEFIDHNDFVPNMRQYFDLAGEPEYDIRDSFFVDTDMVAEPQPKRRRSSILDDFTDRMISRLPSLSRRTRSRKRASVASNDARSEPAMSPQIGRSRSTSRARSIWRKSTEVAQPLDAPSPSHLIETIEEDEDSEMLQHSSGVFSTDSIIKDEVTEIPRAPTPLLPPLMRNSFQDSPVQSPLDSPAIAPSAVYAPEEHHASRQNGIISPPLSTKPSYQSFMHQHPAPHQLTPTSEIPPMLISDPQDEWSDRLGHANFHIYPAPYVPEDATLTSCRHLLVDWEQARAEFSKHLGRTAIHFGESSKTYKLTEEKWTNIDAQWKLNYDSTCAAAAANGEAPDAQSPTEPAPVAKMPVFDDPSSEGKWPKMGDADIVGPMAQAPAIAPPSGSKGKETAKDKVLRIFSGIGRLSNGSQSR